MPVRHSACPRIYVNAFEEATGVVGEVQEPAKLVIGAGAAALVVVVLLAPDFRSELESVAPLEPIESVTDLKGVLRQLGGSGGTPGSSEAVTTAEITNIKIKGSDQGNPEIGGRAGGDLIKGEAGDIGPRLIQDGGSDGTRPAHRGCGIMRQEGKVLEGAIASLEIVSLDEISAKEELILPQVQVHAAVELVSGDCIRDSKIGESVIRDPIRAISYGLPYGRARRVPLAEGTAIQRAAVHG